MGHFPDFYQYGHGQGMVGGGLIMMLVMFVLLGMLLYLFLKKQNGVTYYSGQHQENILDSRNKALSILEERYAKGEIDTEDFQIRKTELSK